MSVLFSVDRTAPGPLCGRVTEENSDEEESESDGTADSTGQTEL